MVTSSEKTVSSQSDDDEQVANSDFAQSFKLLSDETRICILRMLAHDGEMNVNAICTRLGQSQPLISHHLALLRVAKMIQVRRDGKFNFYRVRQQQLQSLVSQFSNLFE